MGRPRQGRCLGVRRAFAPTTGRFTKEELRFLAWFGPAFGLLCIVLGVVTW